MCTGFEKFLKWGHHLASEWKKVRMQVQWKNTITKRDSRNEGQKWAAQARVRGGKRGTAVRVREIHIRPRDKIHKQNDWAHIG